MTDLAVIMSIYKNDRLEFFIESVQSILNQTYTDFHYYLVFDGPVSPEISDYLDSLKDNRIILYEMERNEGLAKALNFLLEIVLKNPDYKFIARMDADDVSHNDRFEKQRSFLLNNSDISCVGCWYHIVDEYGRHLSDRKLPVEHESIKRYYYKRAPFAHPSVIYSRNLIEIAGTYPTNSILMEDNVLWGLALKSGLKFANLPEFLFSFRQDNNYFIRRSGIRYGWNYIKTRFEIISELNLPFYSYLYAVSIGAVKMMPSFIVRYHAAMTTTFKMRAK